MSDINASENFSKHIDDLRAGGADIQLMEATDITDLEGLASKLRCEVNAIFKTVCLNYKDGDGTRRLVAVVLPANRRVDLSAVSVAGDISQKLKSAQPEFITASTGFVPGGIPPIGFTAQWFVDNAAFAHNRIFAGGGNNLNMYICMDPQLLRQLNSNVVEGDFATT